MHNSLFSLLAEQGLLIYNCLHSKEIGFMGRCIFPSPSPHGLRGMIWGVTKSPHLGSSILPFSSAHTHCWSLLTLIHFICNFWSFCLHKGKTLMCEVLACRAGGALGRWPQVGLFTHSTVYKCTKKSAALANTNTHVGPVIHTRITHLGSINGSQVVIYLSCLGIYFRKTEIAQRNICFCSQITKEA